MNKAQTFLGLALAFLLHTATAQGGQPLGYYLPDVPYDPAVPTPASFFGHDIGEWHISHDMQHAYMRALAAASPRLTLTQYARTHELRPLVYLTITTPANHARLEDIRAKHVAASDPARSGGLDLSGNPVVVYQAYTIHGNEPSGGNAAVLMAYYLAAAQSAELDAMLSQMVILLDPCLNPDGFQRFANWVNMHRNKHLTADPADREFNEAWPRGRSNHYWFDLNRDWLPIQHPESRGRIGVFHRWKPHVLTDHHEMGTNSTYFFMPGVPTRANPINPKRNQELTALIGEYHAKELDRIGSTYYTKEGFDDFYAGKGSTYPDFNGCIGILFEQGSSRGHVQESENGLLTFAATIRNQVATSFSTQKAALGLRQELIAYQRDFYQSAREEARKDSRRAFVFGDAHDPARTHHFLDILHTHQVEVHGLAKAVTLGGQRFEPGTAFVVPLEQAQYRLVRGIFETQTSFEDSIFYDISTWTLPLSFNLPYAPADAGVAGLVGTRLQPAPAPKATAPPRSDYAYLIQWDDYYAPKVLHELLREGLMVKVAMKPLRNAGRDLAAGTLLLTVQNQPRPAEEVHTLLTAAAQRAGVTAHAVQTGLSEGGIDLGSNNFRPINPQQVLLLVEGGVSSLSAGEVWFQLDQRYGMALTKVPVQDFTRLNLHRYTTIILPDGGYGDLGNAGVEKLRQWVAEGGNLLAIGRAVRWAAGQKLANVTFQGKTEEDKKDSKDKDKSASPERQPYDRLSANLGGAVLGGAIFEAHADLTHPLLFGYRQPKLPVFRRGTDFMAPAKNAYATPLAYTDKPLLSGYINAANLANAAGRASIIVSSLGRGQVICMADSPVFRGFWFGTDKILANAIFFGSTIDRRAME